jgi:hypothetical protein
MAADRAVAVVAVTEWLSHFFPVLLGQGAISETDPCSVGRARRTPGESAICGMMLADFFEMVTVTLYLELVPAWGSFKEIGHHARP